MSIKENLQKIKSSLPSNVTLIVVTKTQSFENIMGVYEVEHKIFGENKVQELIEKQEKLPKDIEWHLIGHLQRNKVKQIASFIYLIHSVDSVKLLMEINKQAEKNNRIIKCLLQIYIAREESKFGFDFKEAEQILLSNEIEKLKNIEIVGLMGMATNTKNAKQIEEEFALLIQFFQKIKNENKNEKFKILSMGMSSDYLIAVKEGSNMVRVGSSIFGERK